MTLPHRAAERQAGSPPSQPPPPHPPPVCFRILEAQGPGQVGQQVPCGSLGALTPPLLLSCWLGTWLHLGPRGEVGSHPAPHEEHSLGDVSPHCRAEGLQGTRRPWSLWQCNPLPQPPAPAPRRGHGARAGPARWCSRLLVSLLPPTAAEAWVWGLPGAPVTASHREPIPPGGRLPSLHSPCPRGFAKARGRWQWAPCARA